MRWPFSACAVWSVLVASVLADQPSFPYKAYVTAGDVYVRSGPGENYYPTDKLKAGQAVEVYRHDPGGWYAIRPPEGSFSWVSGRQLRLGADGLATVTEERAAARVGSRFSDIREVIQVRLHQGESVEVLDAKRTGPATTTGANTWYKIAPPSGEFRWVSGKFVDAEFARDGVRKTAADGGAVQATGVSATAATAPPSNEPAAGAVLAQPDPSPATPRRVTAEQFQAELNEIDVELSAIVVEEPTVWELGELRQRAQSLMNQAETALERGRARTLVSKIARFEDIKERHNAVAALRDKTERVDRQLAKLGPRPRGAAPATDDSRFDATGYLTRVSKPKPGAPQYALVDQNGKVQSYVTPAPGVNLQSYLGRQVGVTGTRGYMPEQRATHVMARHISAVDATTLR